MLVKTIHATKFKKVLEHCKEGCQAKAAELLKMLQDEYLDLCCENETLKKTLDEAYAVLSISESMEFDGSKYWIVEDLDRKGPYCQLCYDRDGMLIRLQKKTGYHHCLACGNTFEDHCPQSSTNHVEKSKVVREPIQLFAKPN